MRRLIVQICVFVAAMTLAQPAHQVVLAQTEEKFVVPGERIGTLRLAGRLADIEAMFGRGAPRGRGLWDLSAAFAWDAVGVQIMADTASGNILWMSVCACGSNPWAEHATTDGLRFGVAEEQVRAAMGAPTSESGDAKGKALHYPGQGIAFVVDLQGPQAGKVSGFYIYWKHRSPGDTAVVPGRRISVVNIGTPLSVVQSVLGTAGFIYVRRANFEIYHWPHFALAAFVQEGRVVQVTAFFDERHDALGVRYATAQGLGIGSTSEQVRAAFRDTPHRHMLGPIEEWVYDGQGIVFNVASSGPLTGRIVGVGVFAPR